MHSGSLEAVDALALDVVVDKLLEARVLLLPHMVVVEIPGSNKPGLCLFTLHDFLLSGGLLVVDFQTLAGFVHLLYWALHPLGHLAGSQALAIAQQHHLLLLLQVLALALTQVVFLGDELV